MRINREFFGIKGLTAVAFAFALLHMARQVSAQATSPFDATSLAIGVGDTLDVAVFNTPELSFRGRVDENGQVTLPVGGKVTVAGSTTIQAANSIEHALLAGGIMQAPSVTIMDTDFATQGITVLGEVRSPGTFTLLGPHTLYDAISAAGGTSETEGATINITHRNDPDHPEVLPVQAADFGSLQRKTPVYPGDKIFVSRAEMVYVVGDVGHPGAFFLARGQHFTILNTIALAQGDNFTAATKHCSIIRKDGDGAIRIPFDLKKVKENRAPDMVLMAGDVIVVPRNTLKQIAVQALPGLSTSVAASVSSALIIR